MKNFFYNLPFILAIIAVFTLIVGLLMFVTTTAEFPIDADYTQTCTVDKSEKIPIVLSNLVHIVESKNFIITDIDVSKKTGHKFSITVKGTDYSNLISL